MFLSIIRSQNLSKRDCILKELAFSKKFSINHSFISLFSTHLIEYLTSLIHRYLFISIVYKIFTWDLFDG